MLKAHVREPLPGRIICPGFCWACMRPPKEETGVSAAEVALQQQLVVLGQLPPPSERPDSMEEPLVPLAVILPTGRSYAQAATSSPLDGADWVYVARGGAAKLMADKYSRPYRVLERVNKAWNGKSRGAREWRSQQGPLEASPGR